MSTPTSTNIQNFDFVFVYDTRHIPCRAWLSPDTSDVTTLVFLGTVQIEKLGEWTAASCPPGTIVIQGAPHWLAKQDGSDIPQYMFAFTKSAFAAIRHSFTLQNVRVIAESQAVPGVIRALLSASSRALVNRVVLIQPLGLNAVAYNSDNQQPARTFIRRIIQNAHYQLAAMLIDPRLRYNHYLLTHTLNVRSPATTAQYSSGLRYDAGPDLQQLARTGMPMHIICGSRDRIFRPAEIQATLDRLGVPMKVQQIPGVPHSPLATKLGQKLLRAALSK